MGRIVFTPYNQEGESVKRGITSMSSNASREAIAEKIALISRKEDLGRIVHVEVHDKDGFFISAWDVRADAVVQTDGLGSEHFATAHIPAHTGIIAQKTENEFMATNEGATGATTAAKNPAVADGGAKADAKAAKAAKVKAEPKPKVDKGPSKKDKVLALLKAKGGATLESIQKELSITPAAARALIGDCQRIAGVTVKREKVDGVSKYSA